MNELHLFAGAGGGILGGMLLGHTTVCAVEIEEYPRKVLLQRQRDGILPHFPIWDDIQTFDGKPWKGRVDVIAGGFPCQDISAAGKGAGIEGKRSGLWGEMARVIGEIRPRFVFVENSPLLVGRGLAVVLGDLAEMGYDAKWCVLGADDAGAPHKRKRIWLLAQSGSIGTGSQSRKTGNEERTTGREYVSTLRQGDGQDGADRTNSTGSSAAKLCDSNRNGKSVVSFHNEAPELCSDVADTFSKRGCSREANRKDAKDAGQLRRGERQDQGGMGFWHTEPNVGRVANGVAARVDRLKAIGNGQVPHVAALAWTILTQAE